MVDTVDRSLLQTVTFDPTCLPSSPSKESDADLQSQLLETIRSKIHLCRICHKSFAEERSLRTHLAVVHGQGKYHECPDCHTRYKSNQLLLEHRRKSHECDKCDIQFRRKSDAIQHMVTCHGPSFLCPEPGCSKKLLSKGGIKSHLAIYHGKGNVYDCPKCMRHFRREHQLRNHIVSHTLKERKKFKFACRVCDTLFTSKQALLKHKSNVHGPSWFACDQCDKNFPRKSLLLSHKACTHIQLRKSSLQYYYCNGCNEPFQTKGLLVLHNLCNHFSSQKWFKWLKPTKQYICNLCDNTFDTKIHMVVHKEVVHNSTHQWEGAEYRPADYFSDDYLSDDDLSGMTQQDSADDHMPQQSSVDVCDISDTHETKTTVGSPLGADKMEGMLQFDFKDQQGKRLCQEADRKKWSDCNNACNTSCQLFVHDEEVHLNHKIQFPTGESLSVECTEGDDILATNSTLKNGTISTVHGGSWLFQCPDCIFQTSNEAALRLHVEVVHEAVRYQCKDCGLTFMSQTLLNEHRKEEGHSTQLFRCPVCSLPFVFLSALHLHLSQSHLRWLERHAYDNVPEAWFTYSNLSPTSLSPVTPLPTCTLSSVQSVPLETSPPSSHTSSLKQTTVTVTRVSPPDCTSYQHGCDVSETCLGSKHLQSSTSTSDVFKRPLPVHASSPVSSVSSETLPSSLVPSMKQTPVICGEPRTPLLEYTSPQSDYNTSVTWFGSKHTFTSASIFARSLPAHTLSSTFPMPFVTVSTASHYPSTMQITSVITCAPRVAVSVHASSVLHPAQHVPARITPMAFSGYTNSMIHTGSIHRHGPFYLTPSQLVYPSYNFPAVQVPSPATLYRTPTTILPSPTAMMPPYYSSVVSQDTSRSWLPFNQSPNFVQETIIRPQQYYWPSSSAGQVECPRWMVPPGVTSSVTPGEFDSMTQSLGQTQGTEPSFFSQAECRHSYSSKSALAPSVKPQVDKSEASRSKLSINITATEEPDDSRCFKDQSSITPPPVPSLKTQTKVGDTSNRKPRLCTTCGIKFYDMAGVYNHMKSVHTGMNFIIVKAANNKSTTKLQQGAGSNASLDRGRAIVDARQHLPKKSKLVNPSLLAEESCGITGTGSSQRVVKFPDNAKATNEKMRLIDGIAWKLANEANK